MGQTDPWVSANAIPRGEKIHAYLVYAELLLSDMLSTRNQLHLETKFEKVFALCAWQRDIGFLL